MNAIRGQGVLLSALCWGSLCAAYAHAVGANAASADSDSPSPLTTRPGDALRGERVFVNRQSGHCVLCHRVASLDAPSQGSLGPALDTVGSRLSEGQLRKRVMDSTLINPESAMPAYYRSDGLHQVGSAYKGQTVLSAQEVEDVVAYLQSLNSARETPSLSSPPSSP